VSRINNRLSVKIFLGIGASLLITSLLLFALLQFLMPHTYAQQLNAQLLRNKHILIQALENTPKTEWDALLTMFVFDNGASVQVESFDPYGVIVASEFQVNHVTTAFGSEGWDGITAGIFISTAIATATDFWHEGNQYSITVINESVPHAVSQVAGIFPQVFPYVLVMILLISALVAFFYSRFLSSPIVAISGISKKMASLELTQRCDTSRKDEIGALGNNLNQMAKKLAHAMDELTDANQRLQADIEREREHERRRRDFFIAVSHELKTPVTILKGELEGMILNVGKFKDRDKYLPEAYKTSESIENLVREIMTLAKLDNISLTKEDIDLPGLVDTCVNTYKPLAQGKEISITRKYNAAIIHADRAQLQTVLSNIIGNAVKHSPTHSQVEISIAADDEVTRLSVKNTNVQIAPSELAKVWEPFYRTDKSRSRDTGGSGLGLYIVKTILDLHGFEYWLRSTGEGVELAITIRKSGF